MQQRTLVGPIWGGDSEALWLVRFQIHCPGRECIMTGEYRTSVTNLPQPEGADSLLWTWEMTSPCPLWWLLGLCYCTMGRPWDQNGLFDGQKYSWNSWRANWKGILSLHSSHRQLRDKFIKENQCVWHYMDQYEIIFIYFNPAIRRLLEDFYQNSVHSAQELGSCSFLSKQHLN